MSDAFLAAFAERGRLTRRAAGFEIFSLGGAIAKVGENDTAYSSRAAAFDGLAAATWDHPAEDAEQIALTREHWGALQEFARGSTSTTLVPTRMTGWARRTARRSITAWSSSGGSGIRRMCFI